MLHSLMLFRHARALATAEDSEHSFLPPNFEPAPEERDRLALASLHAWLRRKLGNFCPSEGDLGAVFRVERAATRFSLFPRPRALKILRRVLGPEEARSELGLEGRGGNDEAAAKRFYKHLLFAMFFDDKFLHPADPKKHSLNKTRAQEEVRLFFERSFFDAPKIFGSLFCDRGRHTFKNTGDASDSYDRVAENVLLAVSESVRTIF